MKNKTFVDSNILIYAHDVDAKSKYKIANKILRDLWEKETGILSIQVPQDRQCNQEDLISVVESYGPCSCEHLCGLVH
jgi:predicted nucleic acid-binding protein